MSILTNIKKRGLKDIFSNRVFAYIQSQWQKIFGIRVSSKKDAIAYAEQVLFRKIMCPECAKAGACLHCGCAWDELATAQKSTCSQGRFGKIENANSWEEYKSKYLSGIEFGLVKKKEEEK